MNRFKISAFSDEYSPDFRKGLEGMNKLGISYVELRGVDGKNISTLDKAESGNVKELLDGYGIRASSIGSPIGKIALDGDLAAHRDTARRVCEIACEMGAEYIRSFSFYAPAGKNIADCRDEVIAETLKLLDIADEYGVRFCHENEGKIYGESAERCLDLINATEGRLGCVFDMGNFRYFGYEPEPAYELLRDHITYFHIKDSDGLESVVPPGTGTAMIREILSRYASEGRPSTFATLEPHLVNFVGLGGLTDVSIKHAYTYDSDEAAFTDAAERFKAMLN